MKKRFIVLSIAIVSIAVWHLFPQKAISVDTVVASVERIAQTVSNTRSGSVQACRRAKLSMPLGGQISAIDVSEGQRVEQGTLLLSLFNEDIQAQLRQTEAQMQSAQLSQQRACVIADTDQREAKRHQSLFTQGLISDEQLDVTQSRAKASELACEVSKADTLQASAQHALFQAQLSKTQLMAPFAGTIAEINGEVGEYATPSPPGIPTLPMVDLIDDRCFYVSAPIDEVDAGMLEVGQNVGINIDAYRDSSFTGSIRRIAPYVFAQEKQARTVEVEVDILSSDKPLLVGYSADITVEIQVKQSALTIPTQAIFDENNVWVVNHGQVFKRTLILGINNWQRTEVIDGLQQDDLVIVATHGSAMEEGLAATANMVKP